MIVAVSHGDKLLLTKYANRDYSKYSLVAGFVEVGESLEMAVKREVMEETRSQGDEYPVFRQSAMGGYRRIAFRFFAELDGDETITMDEAELKEAAWLPIDQVRELDLNKKSLTSTMMDAWQQGRI